MQYTLTIYTDGVNESAGQSDICNYFLSHWEENYSNTFGAIKLGEQINLKEKNSNVPDLIKRISGIRNPDFIFYIDELQYILGGIEVTNHSPDGSNVEKRYPFIWASEKYSTNSFILCPYQKERSNGQVNKLPNRHSLRNKHFLTSWEIDTPSNSIAQILPIKEFTTFSDKLDINIKSSLLSFTDLGYFFSNELALKISNYTNSFALQNQATFKNKLIEFNTNCLNNTNYTEQSSLIKTPSKWISIYNCRPDSGHWERGEGQFDSIDGRIMFILDEINQLDLPHLPKLEIWLPQMCANHPWIEEQLHRGYGSKRFRNLMVTLKDNITVKFGDQLTQEDWYILQNNPQALLERLDWQECIFKVTDIIDSSSSSAIAKSGLTKSIANISKIEELLTTDNLYICTYKPYSINWKEAIEQSLLEIPENSIVLFPRLPNNFINLIDTNPKIELISGEKCSKDHFQMLRQIHRYTHKVHPYTRRFHG